MDSYLVLSRKFCPRSSQSKRCKVEYPTTEQGLYTEQPRKFKYRKAVSIELTTRQDSTSAISYVWFTAPMAFSVLSTLINS
jgi:hypothetical protein